MTGREQPSLETCCRGQGTSAGEDGGVAIESIKTVVYTPVTSGKHVSASSIEEAYEQGLLKFAYNDNAGGRYVGAVHMIRLSYDGGKALCGYRRLVVPASPADQPYCRRCLSLWERCHDQRET